MDNISLFSEASLSYSAITRPFLPPLSFITRTRTVSFSISRRPNKFSISASKDDGTSSNKKLSQLDLMELKFGQMLGEDPKLTLAKIMHRKVNPDASYLEIEKNFYRNKGKIVEIKEVPFDAPRRGQSGNATNGLNLVRPVPKEGFAVGGGDDSGASEKEKPGGSAANKVRSGQKSSVPNVILRKPSMYGENGDDDAENSSRIQIRPNLSLKMRTEPVKEQFGGMTLLKKPKSVSNSKKKRDNSINVEAKDHGVVQRQDENNFEEPLTNSEEQDSGSFGTIAMLKKPTQINQKNGEDDSLGGSPDSYRLAGTHFEGLPQSSNDFWSIQQDPGTQPSELSDEMSSNKENGMRESPSIESANSKLTVGSTLQGKPNRLSQPVKAVPKLTAASTSHLEGSGNDGQEENSPAASPLNGVENNDWARAEELFSSGERGEVEVISCSTRGFAVSFGSLIGFLPYRNLAAKWKFLAFESWLRKKGLDPSKYRQKLGIIGSYGALSNNTLLESSPNSESHQYSEIEVTADMEMDDLLRIYDQEKIQFLSSFVGQRIRVNVLLANKKSRRLIFSVRPREKEEMVEKKRNLMRKLGIGDVVKCSIKKITYFGIFVEVEGVPALIHQSEVSWDATLDPASYYKVGQIVEAKVHQLDFTLERIFLSLKEITPDPMMEALESVIGDSNSFDGRMEALQINAEWPEVDSLIEQLQAIGGVQAVTKGRFFLSPGLAPTFQVYMASMFENQYKLLARSGNKVQEVMVQASLSKEEMKSVILTCTNKVE